MAIIIEHSPIVVAKHKSGKLATVDQVPKGLACDCFCPDCGSALIAKKGDKVQHHFSHKSHDNEEVNFDSCGYDFWRSLHLQCFKALEDAGGFRMPKIAASHKEMFLEDVYEKETVLVEGQMVNFDSLEYDYVHDGAQLKTIIAVIKNYKFLICPLFSKEKDSVFNSYEYIARKGKGEIPVVLIDMESIKEDFYPTDTKKFNRYVIKDAKRYWSTHGSKVTYLQNLIKKELKADMEKDKGLYMKLLRDLELQFGMEDFKIYQQQISRELVDPVQKFSYLMFSDFDEIPTKNGRHLLFKKREDGYNIYLTISTDKISPPRLHAKEEDVCIWISIPDAWRQKEQIGNTKEIKFMFYKPATKDS